MKRTGKLFAHRYHARPLRTPREVFNALRYVLFNRKHHGAEKRFSKYWVDPYSSAPWFTGWAEPISRHAWMVKDLVGTAPPTKPATVWLLTTGWKRHGLLRFDDAPARNTRCLPSIRKPSCSVPSTMTTSERLFARY